MKGVTAKEANETARKKQANDALWSILYDIKLAAGAGKFIHKYEGSYNEIVIEKLKELGYDVQTGQGVIDVSWAKC